MIEIINPYRYDTNTPSVPRGGGWHYPLDYGWVVDTLNNFRTPEKNRILDVGTLGSRLPAYLRTIGFKVDTMDRQPGHTYRGEFLEEIITKEYDFIMWLSSIEHQPTTQDIQKCFEKSLDDLADNGVFIATFGVGQETEYDEDIEGWTLSIPRAIEIFGEPFNQSYPLSQATKDYKQIDWLRSAHNGRFAPYGERDFPRYVAAGIVRTV